jgi:hypothetical protein
LPAPPGALAPGALRPRLFPGGAGEAAHDFLGIGRHTSSAAPARTADLAFAQSADNRWRARAHFAARFLPFGDQFRRRSSPLNGGTNSSSHSGYPLLWESYLGPCKGKRAFGK